MSRQEDVAYLKSELAKLEAEAKQLQATFQKYEAEVVAAIKEILVAAGVWDEVHAMDTEKAEAAKRAQAKLQEIQAKGQEHVRVLNFLLSREQVEQVPSPSVPSVIDSPVAVADQPVKEPLNVARVAELLGASVVPPETMSSQQAARMNLARAVGLPKKHPTPPI